MLRVAQFPDTASAAPIVVRLAEAIARDGRFAEQERILDVAIALERMYELVGGEIRDKCAVGWCGFSAEMRNAGSGISKL